MNENQISKEIGKRIKKARKEAGISCSELASKVGVSAVSVYFWEDGKHSISISNLYKVNKVLNLDFTGLLK